MSHVAAPVTKLTFEKTIKFGMFMEPTRNYCFFVYTDPANNDACTAIICKNNNDNIFEGTPFAFDSTTMKDIVGAIMHDGNIGIKYTPGDPIEGAEYRLCIMRHEDTVITDHRIVNYAGDELPIFDLIWDIKDGEYKPATEVTHTPEMQELINKAKATVNQKKATARIKKDRKSRRR